ncbi:hypothetical protein K438DRAFT_1760022 [Mycena galopus ATCC 62051]|nr:hypothetical protein K438DRAFT_1760022 [Mycena galopus ATCC 62051]
MYLLPVLGSTCSRSYVPNAIQRVGSVRSPGASMVVLPASPRRKKIVGPASPGRDRRSGRTGLLTPAPSIESTTHRAKRRKLEANESNVILGFCPVGLRAKGEPIGKRKVMKFRGHLTSLTVYGNF